MPKWTCGESTLQAFGPQRQRLAIRAFCRRWECESCGPRKRAKLIKRVVQGAPTTFLTLTLNPALYENRLHAFSVATRAVNSLFKRLRRRFPVSGLQYALVWETTKKGWPHAHILMRAPYIPQALISRHWKELTGSPIVDIRKVKSHREIAYYVAKYLTKNPEAPPHAKRYRMSRLFSAPLQTEGLPDWLEHTPFVFVRQSLLDFQLWRFDDGMSIEQLLPYLWCAYPARPPP